MSLQQRFDRFVAGCVARAAQASQPGTGHDRPVDAADATVDRLMASLPKALKALGRSGSLEAVDMDVTTPGKLNMRVTIPSTGRRDKLGSSGTIQLFLNPVKVRGDAIACWTAGLSPAGELKVETTGVDGSIRAIATKSPASWIDLVEWAIRFWEMGGGKVKNTHGIGGFLKIGAAAAATLLIAMVAHGMWLQSQQETSGPRATAPAAQASPSGLGASGAAGVPAPASGSVSLSTAAATEPTPGPSVGEDLMREVVALARESGIALRDSGKPLYVFSNPSCGACQFLDGQLDLLPKDVNPIILPVGFDVSSLRMTTAALCLDKKDKGQVTGWQSLMKGQTITSSICQAGLDASAKHAKLFARMGFNATPTLVDASGRTIVGGGEAPQIARWVAQAPR